MLTIKCAACKSKLMRYRKIGKGKVLRCYKDRIRRVFKGKIKHGVFFCSNCSSVIGREEDRLIQMHQNAFTYSGKKE